ncbi:MAG: APC family permease [Pedosphaera sp.]|nr:APC family permease [Pedosphaera sp.]
MSSEAANQPRLKRAIGLPGAVMMGLGSILGAGVFVSIGLGAGVAGSGVMLAIVIAAGVATCNGLSSAQLAAKYPVSGGTYEYGYRLLSPAAGFTAGWLFLCAKTATGATAALGFAGYLIKFTGINIGLLPIALIALVFCVLVTLSGIERGNRINIAIVCITVFALTLFCILGVNLAHGAVTPAFAFPETQGMRGLLGGAALMFVAFTGYGRIATLGEEVRQPARTIPRAIILTLCISMVLYLGVAYTGLGLLGSDQFAKAAGEGLAPLEIMARKMGDGKTVTAIVAIGAMTAMLGVLLNLLLGLSRVLLAMGRRSDMPAATANISESTQVPAVATVVVAVLIGALVCIGDVKLTWSFSAFTVLLYYALTNLCAIRLPKNDRLYPVWTAYIGLTACLSLAFFVEWKVMLTGMGLIGIGLIWKRLFYKQD